MGLADCQSGSSRVPSSFGARSTRTASALPARSCGRERDPFGRARAPTLHSDKNKERRRTENGAPEAAVALRETYRKALDRPDAVVTVAPKGIPSEVESRWSEKLQTSISSNNFPIPTL